ncbi:MAG: hypothetical protein ABS939_13785 [Psychrobacillus sp.]
MRKLREYIEFAQGYQEMGKINLEISNEMKHLEDEGAKLNEMGTEKREGNTTA